LAPDSLNGFFAPRSVAVVGASRNPTAVGAKILRNIIGGGFRGGVFPINPHAEEIDGLKCYPNLTAVPDPIELVVIAVPATRVESVLEECVFRRPTAVVVISAGFAEASHEGAMRQAKLSDFGTRGGFRLLGPNCLGMLNTDPAVSLNATFAPNKAPAGTVAVASQSGAFGLLLLDFMAKRGIGLSSFFSIGNRADVSSNDLLEYWENDARTKAVVLYVESFGNPEKFCRIARRVSKTKPIIAVKPGRTKAGARAAASHSAAVIGDARSLRALFEKTGIIEAASVEEVLDLLCYIDSAPLPSGPRVGIVTNGGGPAIMLADCLEERGLEVPILGEANQILLRQLLPENAAVTNPVDMLPAAKVSDYENVLRLMSNDTTIDSIALLHVPVETGSARQLRESLPGLIAHSGCVKPVVPVIMSSGEADAGASNFNFVFPEKAGAALAHLTCYGQWRDRPNEQTFVFDSKRAEELRELCRSAQRDDHHSGWLPIAATEALMCGAGISLPWSAVLDADSPEYGAAAVRFPIVAKLLSPDLLHKSDIGGVICGIHSESELRDALHVLSQRARAGKVTNYSFLLQQQLLNTVEGFVGGIRDRESGPVIVFGLGGKLVQLIDDLVALIPPLGKSETATALRRLRFHSILSGFRGEPPSDSAAFIDIVIRVGALLSAVPEIAELDINPVLVSPIGGGACAADVRVRLYPN